LQHWPSVQTAAAGDATIATNACRVGWTLHECVIKLSIDTAEQHHLQGMMLLGWLCTHGRTTTGQRTVLLHGVPIRARNTGCVKMMLYLLLADLIFNWTVGALLWWLVLAAGCGVPGPHHV
jgi:hypothetical protein